MSKCEDCKQEMSEEHESCTYDVIVIEGNAYKRNTKYHDVNEYCHDCNILNGGVHHMGCDMERCPICDGQMISCDCKWENYSLGKSIVEESE